MPTALPLLYLSLALCFPHNPKQASFDMVSVEVSAQLPTTNQQSSRSSRQSLHRRTLTLGLILEEEDSLRKAPAQRSRPSPTELSSIRSFQSPLTFQQHIRALSLAQTSAHCPDIGFTGLQSGNRPALDSLREVCTVHVTRSSTFTRAATPPAETTTTTTARPTQMLGDVHCARCKSSPSHRLIPCQHSVCYDHLLLGHDGESSVQSVCAKCHQVSQLTSFHTCISTYVIARVL